MSITWAIDSSRRMGYGKTTIPELVMVYLWHLFVIGARVLAMAMLTVQFQFWLLALVVYHCLAMIIISSHSQKFAGEQRYLWRFLVIMEMVAINMFCANAGPRNRHYMAVWYIISHYILYTENVLWWCYAILPHRHRGHGIMSRAWSWYSWDILWVLSST